MPNDPSTLQLDALVANVATTVKQVRKHYAAVRAMKRNVRLDRYQGRNNGGDHTYRERLADEALATLPHRLKGLLTEEHKLAERISENKDLGNPRPELQNRIRVLRNAIRTEIAAQRDVEAFVQDSLDRSMAVARRWEATQS